MKTVKHPWCNPVDVDEIDDLAKYVNQIQGLARLFSRLDIDTIKGSSPVLRGHWLIPLTDLTV